MHRRRFLTVGTTAISTMVAGCSSGTGTEGDSGTSGGGEASSTSDETGTGDSEQTTSKETTSNDTGSGGGGSYSVSMAPVGKVTLESPPKRVAQYFPGYADMAVALGHGDTTTSVGIKSRYHTDYYRQLEGVSVDKQSMTELVTDSGIDKEVFYELNSDLHMIDPQWLINNSAFAFKQADVNELTENVAPFLGNTIFRRTDSWHNYRYYSMYEAFEKVAKVFKQESKYEAFKSFHDKFIGQVKGKLPAASKRPNALLVFGDGDKPEEFSPYRLSDKGTNKKQFHDLGIKDALQGSDVKGLSTTDRGTIDFETMLEVDPQTLLIRGHEDKTAKQFQNTVVAFLKSHSIASQLSAVQNDMVFRGGPIYEGPVQNLFLTERFAKDLYPQTYTKRQLFDRQRVAEIINGNS